MLLNRPESAPAREMRRFRETHSSNIEEEQPEISSSEYIRPRVHFKLKYKYILSDRTCFVYGERLLYAVMLIDSASRCSSITALWDRGTILHANRVGSLRRKRSDEFVVSIIYASYV